MKRMRSVHGPQVRVRVKVRVRVRVRAKVRVGYVMDNGRVRVRGVGGD